MLQVRTALMIHNWLEEVELANTLMTQSGGFIGGFRAKEVKGYIIH